MKVMLGTFARSGIRARLGSNLTLGVRQALSRYVLRDEAKKATVKSPFLRNLAPCSGEDLELLVDQEIRDELEREARETDGVSVEQLAQHAVLLYLAELDRSGSVLEESDPLAPA